jgi:ribosome biogenesis protein MAK21
MQPLSGGDNRGIFLSTRAGDRSQQPLNTEKFWHKKAEDVAADEVFFHKYFSQMGKSKQASGKKKVVSQGTEESRNENSEDEDEIWQALVDSRPEVEGPSDDDSDMEMLDLDESDMSADDLDTDNEDDLPSPTEGGAEEAISDGQSDDLAWESEGESDVEELFSKELQTGQSEETTDKGRENSKEKRRKLKSLPTFASVEDYAELLDNDKDEEF